MAPPPAPSCLPAPEALPVQLRQLTQPLLQLLPGRHPLAHRLGQVPRHIVAGGGAVWSPETDVEMGAVLVALVTAAAGAATGAVGLRQGPEQSTTGQAGNLAKQGVSGSKIRNRH